MLQLVEQPEACIGAQPQKDILNDSLIFSFININTWYPNTKLVKDLAAFLPVLNITSSLLKGLQALISNIR